MLRAPEYNRGFTLLETLIYIALFSFLLSGILVSTFYLIDGVEKTRTKLLLEEEGNFLLRKITWALSDAEDVSVVPTPPTMVATKPGPLVLAFDVSGGALRVNTIPLSGSGFTVSNILFKRIVPAGKPVEIRVGFQLNGKPFEIKKYLRQ